MQGPITELPLETTSKHMKDSIFSHQAWSLLKCYNAFGPNCLDVLNELHITPEEDISHSKLPVRIGAPGQCKAKYIDKESMAEPTGSFNHLSFQRSRVEYSLQVNEFSFKRLIHWMQRVAEFPIKMVAHHSRLGISSRY